MFSETSKHKSSFRDPSGFIFTHNGEIYRQINSSYQTEYDAYISSGLHEKLVAKDLLIAHQSVSDLSLGGSTAYRIIKPDCIPFITYPYEWCFSQLKDAALLTLKIQKMALKHGFTLKDASAFNVQFRNGKPIFIDTLSFERYQAGPWVAYKQFCQHFLAPLLLAKYCDRRLTKLSEVFIDGVPLDLASRLLPIKTWFSFSTLTNIHIHARMQNKYADASLEKESSSLKKTADISKKQLLAIIDSLTSAVNQILWKTEATEWGDYYNNTNYNEASMIEKRRLVKSYLSNMNEKMEIFADVGANNGEFSRIAEPYAEQVVAFDIDEVAVEKNYLACKNSSSTLLPVVLDLFNPSAGIGWANEERDSFVERARFDGVMALALIHHLAISNNVPLRKIVQLFHHITKRSLIIEFVPKEDSQVRRLLATREDVFPDYHLEGFIDALSGLFSIESQDSIPETDRTLFLLSRL